MLIRRLGSVLIQFVAAICSRAGRANGRSCVHRICPRATAPGVEGRASRSDRPADARRRRQTAGQSGSRLYLLQWQCGGVREGVTQFDNSGLGRSSKVKRRRRYCPAARLSDQAHRRRTRSRWRPLVGELVMLPAMDTPQAIHRLS
jgi:hypothetical protein